MSSFVFENVLTKIYFVKIFFHYYMETKWTIIALSLFIPSKFSIKKLTFYLMDLDQVFVSVASDDFLHS